jgi:predicted nucleotidyltransferase
MNDFSPESIVRDPRLAEAADEHPYPLLFATVSGAHLYGFPSPDSDFDLRGVHLLPWRDVAGLHPPKETFESSRWRGGVEVDVVTHDAKKCFQLLLKKDGIALENIQAPLIVRTSPEHEELKEISLGCATRHHIHHYLGLAKTRWKFFEEKRQAKPLLYAYRALLTGLRLMRTGQVETNLPRLNEEFRLPYIDGLIRQKAEAGEKGLLGETDSAFHEREIERLRAELEDASAKSSLPEVAPEKTFAALNDLLIRLRQKTGAPS